MSASASKRAILATLLMLVVVCGVQAVSLQTVSAYGECDDYGIMAMYDILTDSCKCMSGYVMGRGVLGDTQCVSGSSVCYDKYGYNASYDSFSKSCECNYGYTLANKYGQTQCVSLDSQCTEQLGIHSRYDSLSDKCKCSYGYIIDGGRCTDGDSVCHIDHGYRSSYNNLSNRCECDSGYTLSDSSQCVEKQNNVYFKLLDVDTDSRQAIIKSDYDGRRYLISYGTGCYASSIRRYLNQNLVVNLGTDFDLDTWDTIVLQDDDETCNITHREQTYEDSLDTEEDSYYYVPPTSTYTAPTPATQPAPPTITAVAPQKVVKSDFEVPPQDVENLDMKGVVITAAAFRRCPSTQCTVIRYYAETSDVAIIGKHKNGDWYEIAGTTDAGGTGDKVAGWIHVSLITIKAEKQSVNVLQTDNASESNPGIKADNSSSTPKKGLLFSIWSRVLNWFK